MAIRISIFRNVQHEKQKQKIQGLCMLLFIIIVYTEPHKSLISQYLVRRLFHLF